MLYFQTGVSQYSSLVTSDPVTLRGEVRGKQRRDRQDCVFVRGCDLLTCHTAGLWEVQGALWLPPQGSPKNKNTIATHFQVPVL